MEEQTGHREWDWIRPLLPLGLCLTVVHGVDPDVLADRLGVALALLTAVTGVRLAEADIAGPLLTGEIVG